MSEQCTSSQGLVEDSLQTSSLDIRQLSLLNGSHFNARFSEKEQRRVGFLNSKSLKETYNYLTPPNTKEKYIAFMRASLAKICQCLEKEPDWKAAQEVVSTGKFSVLLGKLDQDTSSLKTSQQSFIQDLNESWETWPRWGLMRNGAVYAHPKSALRIPEIGGGCWLPTPLKSDHMKFLKFKKKSVLKSTFGSHVNSIPYFLAAQYGRIPSEEMLTWVMGFPNGWAQVSQWVTPKSRSKPQSPTDSLEVAE
jgi:hypothetical protein